MLPREVDGAVLQGFLHKGGADGRPAEVRLLSQGRGSGPSTSGEEKARGSRRARHRVRRPRPQLRPLRLRSGGSSVGPRPSRACDWPPGPTWPRVRLGEAACVHGAQGGPSPPCALPLLQQEARAPQAPCLPLLRVSCSPRQSCFPSSSPSSLGGGGGPAGRGLHGLHTHRCTRVHGHASAAHAAPPVALGPPSGCQVPGSDETQAHPQRG